MSNDKSEPLFGHRSILRSSGIVASGVLASRFLGFIRDVIIAHFMGTGMLAEAFFVAQRIPNLLRDLVGEGAANAAIVPVLSEYNQKKSRAEWQELINTVMAWGVIILGAITIAGMIAAPWIVRWIAPGFMGDAAKFQLTVDLARIMFPYLILIALTAFQVGILYTLQSFAAPAFGPCLLNVAMIASVWAACLFSWHLAYALSVGVLIGGVLQLAAQGLALKKRGVRWAKPKTLNNEGVKRIWSLLAPRAVGSGVYQLNVFADTFCASLAAIVGAGGIAAIYYANRIVQLPLGVFGYALSSVTLSSLSKLASEGKMEEFRLTVSFALRKLTMVLVPSAMVMAVLGQVIIRLAFQRGSFDTYSTQITSQALMFFALGLPFYGISRIFVSAFYALQDTKTPVKAAALCLVINVVLNFVLMYPLKIGGIALASSISSLVNSWILWTVLNKKLKRFP